jgi:hypothetical protein
MKTKRKNNLTRQEKTLSILSKRVDRTSKKKPQTDRDKNKKLELRIAVISRVKLQGKVRNTEK